MSDKETVKNYFDKVAEGIGWLEMNYGHPLWVMRTVRRIIKEESSKRIAENLPLKFRVVDVGCGTGWISREIAKTLPDSEVVGIDFSESMIERARRLTSKDKHDYENLSYKVADAENIPYPGNYFDYAICGAIFSFLPDPDPVLKEMTRILKPGGRLYVADVCKDNSLLYFMSKLSNYFLPCKMKFYSREEYKGLFEKYFVDIYQEKVHPLGGLLTVGSKSAKA